MDKKKECKILSLQEHAYNHSETNMHANRYIVENYYEPQDYIIQRHLTNMVETYGREFIVEVIGNMGLDKSNTKKAG